RADQSRIRPGRTSVDDVDGCVDTLAGAGRSHDGPYGLGDPAPLPDDLAHVARRDVQTEVDAVAAEIVDLDDDGVGLVDDLAGHVLEDGARQAAHQAVADVGLPSLVVQPAGVASCIETVSHDDAPAWNCSHAPEIFSSFSTVSVGFAPCESH